VLDPADLRIPTRNLREFLVVFGLYIQNCVFAT
jgi:hypothetical protein